MRTHLGSIDDLLASMPISGYLEIIVRVICGSQNQYQIAN